MVDERQNRRVERIVEVRDPFVAAIDRQRVLGEVVRTDTEKIALVRQGIGDERRRRYLDLPRSLYLIKY